MAAESQPRRVVEHRRHGEGPDALYRLVVKVGTEEVRVSAAQTVEADILRTFEWGPVPIVPDGANVAEIQEAYRGIHERPLQPGDPVVTEAEYVALQLYEAVATLDAEQAEPPRGKRLPGEGLEL